MLNLLPNSGLQQTKTSLRSAFAAEACYVSQSRDARKLRRATFTSRFDLRKSDSKTERL
jgi:hypothetical protein